MNSKLRVKVWSSAAALCLALFAPNVFAQGACKPVPQITPGPSVIGGKSPYACPVGQGVVVKYNALVPAEKAAQAQHDGSQGMAPVAEGAANAVQGGIGATETAGAGQDTGGAAQSGVQKAADCMGITTPTKAALMAIPPTIPPAGMDPACDGVAVKNSEEVCMPKKQAAAAECAKMQPNLCVEKTQEYETCLVEKAKEDLEGCHAYCLAKTEPVGPAATACQGGMEAIGQKCSDLGQSFKGMAQQAAQSMMDQAGKKDAKKDDGKKDDKKKNNEEPKPDNTQAQAYNPSTGLPTSATPSNLVAPYSGNTDTVTSDGKPGLNVTAGDVPHGEVAQAIANATNALTSSKKSLTGEALPEGSGLGASTIGKASEYAPAKPLPGASYSGGSSFGSGSSFGAASETPKNIVGEGMNYFGLFVDEAGNEKTRELSLFEIPRDAPRRQERYKVMAEYWTTLKLAAQQRKDSPTASAERVPAAATPQKQ